MPPLVVPATTTSGTNSGREFKASCMAKKTSPAARDQSLAGCNRRSSTSNSGSTWPAICEWNEPTGKILTSEIPSRPALNPFRVAGMFHPTGLRHPTPVMTGHVRWTFGAGAERAFSISEYLICLRRDNKRRIQSRGRRWLGRGLGSRRWGGRWSRPGFNKIRPFVDGNIEAAEFIHILFAS